MVASVMLDVVLSLLIIHLEVQSQLIDLVVELTQLPAQRLILLG